MQTAINISSEQRAAHAIHSAAQNGRAVVYSKTLDSKHNGITWTVYGLLDTNEIAVVASIDKFSVGITAESAILVPQIKDRPTIKLSRQDESVMTTLVGKLWDTCGESLVTRAHKDREPDFETLLLFADGERTFNRHPIQGITPRRFEA